MIIFTSEITNANINTQKSHFKKEMILNYNLGYLNDTFQMVQLQRSEADVVFL